MRWNFFNSTSDESEKEKDVKLQSLTIFYTQTDRKFYGDFTVAINGCSVSYSAKEHRSFEKCYQDLVSKMEEITANL